MKKKKKKKICKKCKRISKLNSLFSDESFKILEKYFGKELEKYKKLEVICD